MAQARTTMQPHVEQADLLHEDPRDGDAAEETLDESADPLEESGRTLDSSEDESVDDMVAEDIEKFENSFVGINKRYRLINRIGEGTSHDWLVSCRHAARLTRTCRHFLHRVQGRGSGVLQVQQPLGHRRA